MAPSRGLPRIFASKQYVFCRRQSRAFATIRPLLSGHNRWSKIKHDKGKNDAVKNRQRSSFAQEIVNASKLYGSDPAANPRLADVIAKAKREGFAKASIEAAVARGQGRGVAGEKLENVTVEGILPANIGVVVECETDNKARTMMDLRHALKEAGGAATSSAYLFEKRGRIMFESGPGKEFDQILDAALDAGATDIEEGEDAIITVLCEPSETDAIGTAISGSLSLPIQSSEIVWKPAQDTMIGIETESQAAELGAFVDELYDREPSVKVAMNVAPGTISEDIWRDLQARLRT